MASALPPPSLRLRAGLALFCAMHAACLLALVIDPSPLALGAGAVTYAVQMFGMSAGHHRYFAHRTFDTSRVFQLVLAVLATLCGQQGPLWWAGHHRQHHRHADTPADVHPPHVLGFWWAHVGWITSGRFLAARLDLVPDLVRFPELRLLDRYHMLPPAALALLLFGVGSVLARVDSSFGATGPQLLVWGFCLPTTLAYHATFAVNSVAHTWGTRRFATPDESRNNALLGVLAFGEGWHNNHHRCPGSERNGFYWWEIDLTHYLLTALSWLGVVWNLHAPSPAIYAEAAATGGRSVPRNGHAQPGQRQRRHAARGRASTHCDAAEPLRGPNGAGDGVRLEGT